MSTCSVDSDPCMKDLCSNLENYYMELLPDDSHLEIEVSLSKDAPLIQFSLNPKHYKDVWQQLNLDKFILAFSRKHSDELFAHDSGFSIEKYLIFSAWMNSASLKGTNEPYLQRGGRISAANTSKKFVSSGLGLEYSYNFPGGLGCAYFYESDDPLVVAVDELRANISFYFDAAISLKEQLDDISRNPKADKNICKAENLYLIDGSLFRKGRWLKYPLWKKILRITPCPEYCFELLKELVKDNPCINSRVYVHPDLPRWINAVDFTAVTSHEQILPSVPLVDEVLKTQKMPESLAKFL